MRDLRIVLYGDDRRIGVIDDDNVVDAEAALAKFGGKFAHGIPRRLGGFIAEGEPLIAELRDAVAAAGSASRQPALGLKLVAPWPRRRIAAVGSNYAKHSLGMRAGRGETTTIEEIETAARAGGQWGFFKVAAEVLGPEDSIPYPSRTRYLDYEGELAVVIGKAGRNIPRERALEHIWGVTLFNDLSIRDDEMGARPMSYNLAKNFDGSAAMGPAILVGDLDPRNLPIETHVNGELRQSYGTAEMIFPFSEVIEYLSRDFTLVPGDVISGGTSAGTAQDSTRRDADGKVPTDRFLKPGDTVSVSSPRIGVLENRVVSA
jgi:acylpyruvate hydrolase